jgi:DNA-binding NtrC family response regulator
MALARLVVVEGPDVGREFPLPLRGGGIGRGDDMTVALGDPSVSRHHASLELVEGRFVLVDAGSRNRTRVNGDEIVRHLLDDGDEIAVGKTRMVFLPGEGGVALVRQGTPSRVTMEVGSGELLRARDVGAASGDDRARRHLSSLARFADRLRAVGGRPEVLRAIAEAAREALAADRAVVLERDGSGRVTPSAAATTGAASLAVASDVVERVLGTAVTVAAADDGAALLGSPLIGASGGAPFGLIYAERAGRAAWDEVDVMALACLAHLAGAALAGEDARAQLASENQQLTERLGGGEFVGRSAEARALFDFIAKVAPTDATVLVTGESGAGKEMVARAVHRGSRRARQPFIAVNCAALTQSLIESELFGHEKGAFTGATERKMGRFEAADKGTLFLDEVGELPLDCQTKFLRVLEEQRFERVGGARPIHVDVRVVAATNRDLTDMIRRGAFREDLFYRLSVIHAIVPPLRARPSDVPLIAEHFLHRLKKQVPRRVTGFAPDAMAALCAHPWPGNVRELRNAIERALVLGDGELVRLRDLPPNLGGAGWSPAVAAATAAVLPADQQTAVGPALPVGGPPPMPTPMAPASPLARSLKDLERDGIIAALQQTGGNKVQAAAILEIDRSTLYKKIKDYGIQ